jgi:rhodanese-related sulfurtransferase
MIEYGALDNPRSRRFFMVRLRSRLMFALMTLLAAGGPAVAANPTQDSLATVQSNVAAGKAVLVDVREKTEWDQGHLEGSVLLPLSSLKNGVDGARLERVLPKDKIVYTFCVVGKRAVTGGTIVEKFGYDVRPLKPGYNDLLKAGFKKAGNGRP